MFKFLKPMKSIFDNFSIVMIILVALFTLLVDGPNFKDKGFEKEYGIVKVISYSYITIGIIIFILLRVA